LNGIGNLTANRVHNIEHIEQRHRFSFTFHTLRNSGMVNAAAAADTLHTSPTKPNVGSRDEGIGKNKRARRIVGNVASNGLNTSRSAHFRSSPGIKRR
jgi:hypothetical protein